MKEKLGEVLTFFWPFLKPDRGKYFLCVGSGFISEVLDDTRSLYLGIMIDLILEGGGSHMAAVCGLVYLVCRLVYFGLDYYRIFVSEELIVMSAGRCRKYTARKLQYASLSRSSDFETGDIMRRLYQNTNAIFKFAVDQVATLAGQVGGLLLMLVVCFRIGIIYGAAALIAFGVLLLFLYLFGERVAQANRKLEEISSWRLVRMKEALDHLDHIRRNGISDIILKRFDQTTRPFLASRRQTDTVTYLYQGVYKLTEILLEVFLIFYGGFAVYRGDLTVGNFTVLYSYYNLLAWSLRSFVNLGQRLQEQAVNCERVRQLCDICQESNGETVPDKINYIRVENLCFSYSKEPVLSHFSCSFEKGNLYVVTGENGSGKSTLMSLLMGLYIDEYTGIISYNGHSIRELDMRRIRAEKIGVAIQETGLMNGSIRYNMSYNNQMQEDEKLLWLSRKVSLDLFLEGSAKGLETEVGDGGDGLSGGQKQKISLVKAFYKNPDVLILDEPTSAMDAEGKALFLKFLSEQKADRIIIAVTHDRDLIEEADERIDVLPAERWVHREEAGL